MDVGSPLCVYESLLSDEQSLFYAVCISDDGLVGLLIRPPMSLLAAASISLTIHILRELVIYIHVHCSLCILLPYLI